LKVTFTETPISDWNGGNVNEYELYRLNEVSGAWVFMASSSVAYFELTRFIVACTEYNFTVTAMNGYGESDRSGSYTVTTGTAPSRLDENFLLARNDATGGFVVTVAWGSEEFSNGGCLLLGFGYWEHSAWNTTNPFCYVTFTAYDDTA
jgi:hypothetical protein